MNLTSEQAIIIAEKLMEEFSPHKFYRFNSILRRDKVPEPYWMVTFLLLDKHGNKQISDPDIDVVNVIDSDGEAFFPTNF
jgi:hypothetical protein